MQWKCLTIDFERQREYKRGTYSFYIFQSNMLYFQNCGLRGPTLYVKYIYIYIYVYKKVGEGFQMWLRHWYVNVFNQGCRGSTANFEEVCEIKIP